jgi:hypothetical protein
MLSRSLRRPSQCAAGSEARKVVQISRARPLSTADPDVSSPAVFGTVLVRFAPAEREPASPLHPSLRLEPCLRLIRGRPASAVLYRMDLPDHPRPWGLRTLRLRAGRCPQAAKRPSGSGSAAAEQQRQSGGDHHQGEHAEQH